MAVFQPANGGSANKVFIFAFGVVWVAGILTSLLSLRLAISGTLWDLGFPHSLIPMTMLVGIWQWVWITPILVHARRKNRRGLYEGLRGGAVWFSFVHLSLCTVVYLVWYFGLRHFSFH